MSSPKGIIYLEDFDEPLKAEDEGAEEDIETIAPVFTEEDLSRAREEGYAEGLAAGRALSLSLHEEALRRSLAALEAEMDKARGEAEGIMHSLARRLAETVLGSLSAVLPSLVRRYGADEIMQMVAAVVPRVALEADLRLRVEEVLVPDISHRLRALGSEIADRIVIEPVKTAEDAPVRAVLKWRLGEAEIALDRLRERLAELWLRFGLEEVSTAEDQTILSGEPVHAE